MRRFLTLVGLVLLVGFVYGCQPSSNAPNKDSNTTSSRTGASDAADPTSGSHDIRLPDPKETVQAFLEALRIGDDTASTAMLTTRAQKETAAKRLAIKPPGSRTAEFTVTEMELRGKNSDAAQVLSTWTDTDTRGIRQTYDIVWLLRREKSGWAIMGMATRVFDDQEPLVLDFEKPDEMMRERKRAEQEITRRTQAQQPGSETERVAEQSTGTRR